MPPVTIRIQIQALGLVLPISGKKVTIIGETNRAFGGERLNVDVNQMLI